MISSAIWTNMHEWVFKDLKIDVVYTYECMDKFHNYARIDLFE